MKPNYKKLLNLTAACLLVACTNGQTSTEPEIRKRPEESAAPAVDLSGQPSITIEGKVRSEENETSSQIVIGPGLQRLADIAIKDLGPRMNVDQSDIEILEADYVTWRDSSLGCPKPGHQYMQVLTNGSRMRLRVAKQVYQYHSGGNRAPFLCESPTKTEPLPYTHGEA